MNGAGTRPRIDDRRCTLCGLCVAVCTRGALTLQSHDTVVTDPERCDACGACEEICPQGAIDCQFEIVWGEGQEPATGQAGGWR